MAWDTDLVTLLRVMVDDQDSAVFSDTSLKKMLVTAAQFVLMEMDFDSDYTVEISGPTITPDPTVTATRDDSFSNLTLLKAACLIERGEALKAARQAAAGKDGGMSFDLRDRGKYKVALLDKNYCKEYESAKMEHLTGQTRVAGAAVLTPFRVYARDSGRLLY